MHGVAQLDTADLPLVTPCLEGIEVLTLFIADDLPGRLPQRAGLVSAHLPPAR
jgi:hypothetical protein